MPTYLPRDDDDEPMPALRLRQGGAHVIAATAVSARNAAAFQTDTRIVSVCATGPVHLRFGDAAVVATAADHYLPVGIYADFAIGGGRDKTHYPHLAVLAAGADCAVHVSERD